MLTPAPAGLLIPTALREVSSTLSRVVIGLLFAQVWLAQSTLSIAQMAVEVLLGGVLVAMLAKCRLQWMEIALLVIFGASLSVSIAINPPVVTLLLAKVFGLSLLSLLVFSHYRFETRDALWVLGVNVALTLWQRLFGNPGWFLAIVLAVGETWRDFAGSRPLGLFMSTHASATLSALMFLRLTSSRLLAGFGLATLVASGSTNVLLAYAGQWTERILERLRLKKLALVVGLVALVAAFFYVRNVLDFDPGELAGIVSGREQVSYSVIIGQLFSPEYYERAFTLVPGNPQVLYNDASGDWPNEIGYLATLQQGGFILGAAYLALLLTRIRGFRVFMAIGMLHFNMQTIPIVLFLLLQWSQRPDPALAHGKRLYFVNGPPAA